MVIFTNNSFELRRFFKILRRTLLIIVLLLLLLYGALHLPVVQTWAVKKIAANLSGKLNTSITIKHVDLAFFNKLAIEGLMIQDRNKDTLLYAGLAKVNLTDWFFLKNEITLEYISLQDGYINAHRTDSTWNYQFLVDYFTSPSTGKKKKGTEVDLKEVHLVNIKINEEDKWIGKDMHVMLGRFDMVIKKIDKVNKEIAIESISINSPAYTQSDYEGKRPPSDQLSSVVQKIPVVSAFKWNNSGWTVSVANLDIKNGLFKNDKETIRAEYIDRFDGQHLLFTKVNGSFRNVRVINDTLSARVNLSAVERSGLEIKELVSDMRFTPDMMEFNKLSLRTNKSHLGDYYSMLYTSFNSDMSDFIHKVVLEGHFKHTEIHSDDLAIFAPDLKTWKRKFIISGNAKGSVDNFIARGMSIKSGSTSLTGNLALRGLPDISTSFIDLNSADLQTNYNELSILVPSIKNVHNPQLQKLGDLRFRGSFIGFTNDFVAFGTLNSSLGTVSADVNMKLQPDGVPLYSGNINIENFRAGYFLNSSQLGNLSMSGRINGQGFSLADLRVHVDGKVQQLHWLGYTYHDINLSGNFNKQIFTGHIDTNDPNIQIKTLDGTISLSGKQIEINAEADIRYINMQKLGFSKSNLSFSGLFNLNFTGNNIDNFLGTAKVYDAQLKNDTTRLAFDSLTLISEINPDNSKSLSIRSNEIDGKITGKFSIADLQGSFKYFLSRYYPKYIDKPAYAVKNQDFSFDIITRQIDQYLQIFDKNIYGLNDAHLSGRLDMNNSVFLLNAKSPEFRYGGKTFKNLDLTANGNRDTLHTNIAADDIYLSDSLHFPTSNLSITSYNDISEIKLKTSAGNYLSDAELNATIETLPDGVRIRFAPSTFILNEKRWSLRKDGELIIRKNFVHADDIHFEQADQQLTIGTELSRETNETDIVFKLTKMRAGDFIPFLFTKPSLSGILTGTAVLKDPFGKMQISFKGISDSTTIDGNNLGNIALDATADIPSGLITYKANSLDSTNQFDITGTYNYKDSSDNQLNAKIIAGKLDLKILQPYLSTVFSKIDGSAKTNLQFFGNVKHFYVVGDATITSGSVTVAYTQCKYLFENEKITLGKDEIDLDRIRLRDTLNNEGLVSGKMHHQFFKRFSFDNMRFETAKLLLLNTTKKDNKQFYGNVIGNAVMRVNGPSTNIVMDITGAPSELDSSHIYLPSGTTRESNVIDYIDFIQFGTQMDDEKGTEASNVLVNLNISANPACRVDVILDETTGDIIKGQGTGNISIKVGNREPLSIRGRYDILQGEYSFNFQTFFHKPFSLNSGYIRWDGDPYQAIIDIKAEYLAKNVDVSVLDPTRGVRLKEDITIVSHLTGVLLKPDIEFEFHLQDKSTLKGNYIAVKKLEDFQNDKTEMNKQVASLLLFNSFLSTQENFLSYENTLAIATNTVGGILSGWLTNMLNKQLERATNGVLSTYIDINPTLNLQAAANQLQANIRAGLKILLSNRLVFLLGGNIEYNNPTSLQLARKGLITPDITIEWLLNKEGSLRVIGFNRTSIDLTIGQRNRSGLQLTYRKESDRPGDIFKSRKKIEELARKRHTRLRQ